MKSTTLFKLKISIISLLLLVSLSLFSQNHKIQYDDNWGKQGLSLLKEDVNELQINFSLEEYILIEKEINNENYYKVITGRAFLPNNEGAPDVPALSRYIAVPQDATVHVDIKSMRTEELTNIEIAPAPRIPFDTEAGPLLHEKDLKIYKKDALYPEKIVKVSDPIKIRGVDVVLIAVNPFRYNPVTKQMNIYRDMIIDVTFEGGNGHFGEDRLRSRWWDPIIRDAIINESSIPDIAPHAKTTNRETGCEYLIITPNDEIYLSWADSIRRFRTKQGILTNIVTTADVGGNSSSAIEAYINDAYNNWDIPPVAVLLMADYGTSGNSITSPIYDSYCITDNIYADIDNDHLPDIIFTRMTAQNEAHLEIMVTKFLNYERTPPTNPDFYLHPITAMGWQTERWFQICSESVAGYFENIHGKEVMRENALYEGSPSGGIWSTASNTTTILNVFAENGLGYIPDDPGYLTDWGGNATRLNNDINSGAFILQHRDHGGVNGWGEPDYGNSDINGLTNEDLTFVFSINCLTGKFNVGGECFAEKFHRHPYGALGIIAATESSYSFVNDTYVWGMYDNMWPDFLPMHGTTPESRDVLPAFGNVAGKYFLQQSSWPYNSGSKEVTYYLFHHHGDAFSTVYYDIPQDLDVTHDEVLLSGVDYYSIQVNEGALICLSVGDQIIGLAEGTGNIIDIPIILQDPGTEIDVVITKQNYYRYESEIEVIPPAGAYCLYAEHTLNDSLGNDNGIPEINENIFVDLVIKNLGTEDAEGVNALISSSDPYITLLDTVENYGDIGSGEFINRDLAFKFSLSNGIPDQHVIQIDVSANDNQDSLWISKFYLTVNAPKLSAEDIIINDSETGNDNGYLDPGETADLIIALDNKGHDSINNVVCSLVPFNQYITVNSSDQLIPIIDQLSTILVTYNITVAEDAPEAIIAEIHFNAYSLGYSIDKIYYPNIGIFLEDWETGDFGKYEWENSGNSDWTIDDVFPYEGDYHAKSGSIGHNSSTSFELTYEVMGNNSNISFYRSVSSEASWDFLHFYIDNNEQGKWSGNQGWRQETYAVTEGVHTFKWEYKKDGNTTGGSDCAWIDYIELPAMMTTTLFAGPDDEICSNVTYQCMGTATNYDTIMWSTSGDGSFDATHIVNPVYTFGFNDINNDFVNLIMTIIDVEDEEFSDEMTLIVNNVPEPPTAPDGENSFCIDPGESVYTTEFVEGYAYEWFFEPSSAGIFESDSNSATVSWNSEFTGAASIKVKATNECGEGEFSEILAIDVHNNPEVNLGDDTEVCIGTHATLDAGNEGAQYLWSTGETTQTIDVDTTGMDDNNNRTVSVLVTDQGSCSSSDETMVHFRDCSGINENSYLNGFEIFPNPSGGIITIKLNSLKDQEIIVELISSMGKIGYSEKLTINKGQFSKMLNVQHLPNQLYYLRINSKDGIISEKLIIE